MRTAIALLLGMVAAACVDVDFVEGVRCSDSEQCGRSLACEQGFCGGCPEEGVLADGRCGCPGDRIFECRVITAAPYCVDACPSRRDRCAVAVVLADDELRTLDACASLDEGASDPCFEVIPGSSMCAEGLDELRVVAPELTVVALVANCPPEEHELLQCPPQ